MRNERLAITVITVIATLLFIGPLLTREVFVFRDHLVYFLPLRHFTAEVLRSGHLPLWNPYNAAGEPWLANPQTGVFYPPTWIFLIAPFPAAYMLFLLLHLIITGSGAYFLFARRVSAGAAMAGAVALMICGPTLSLMDVGNNLTSFAWLPWILFVADRRADSPLLDSIPLSLCFLGGEPVFAAFGAIAYGAIVLAQRGSLRRIAIAGIGAFALSAVQLLPFLEWLRGSDRVSGLSNTTLGEQSMHPADWIRLVVPPPRTAAGETMLVLQFIPLLYIGIVAGVLAVLGLIVAIRRRCFGQLIAIAVLLLLALMFSAGSYLPTGSLIARLPFRYPQRMIPVGIIGIAGLVAIGWDALRRDKRWFDIVIALLIVVDVVPRARPLLNSLPFDSLRVPYNRAIGASQYLFRLPTGPSTNTDPIAWMWAYQNLYDHRFDAASGTPVLPMRYLRVFQKASFERRVDLLDFMSAGFILCDQQLPLPQIERLRSVTAYRNAGALPMATFWSHAISVPSDDAALQQLIGSKGGTLFVTPSVSATLVQSPPMIAAIRDVRIANNKVDLIVDAPRDGAVMIAQRASRGWKVSVDGHDVQPLVASGLFRAVEVTRGHHVIEWRYRPLSVVVGFVITTIAILTIAAFHVLPHRLRRRE